MKFAITNTTENNSEKIQVNFPKYVKFTFIQNILLFIKVNYNIKASYIMT